MRTRCKNYAPKLCNVTLGPSALGQHYTTSGHNFSVLTSLGTSQYLYIVGQQQPQQTSSGCSRLWCVTVSGSGGVSRQPSTHQPPVAPVSLAIQLTSWHHRDQWMSSQPCHVTRWLHPARRLHRHTQTYTHTHTQTHTANPNTGCSLSA